MTQKSAGQEPYKKAEGVNFEHLDAICNGIVIEAMALYLYGEFDKLEVKNDG